MAYARIENEEVREYSALPKTWTFTKDCPDREMTLEGGEVCAYRPFEAGASTGNFSDMPEFVHREEGFLPLVDVIPEYNPTTQYLETGEYTIEETQVTKNYLVIDISEEALESAANAKLSGAKAEKKQAIENERFRLLLAGFTYLGKTFVCDREAKVNMMIQYQAFQIEGVFPEDFGWKASGEDELTPMTEEQFKEFIKQAGLYCSHIYTTSFSLKKQVESLTTIDDVTNFAINFE